MQTMMDEAGSITGSTDQTRAQDHSPTPASEASSTVSLSNQDEGRIAVLATRILTADSTTQPKNAIVQKNMVIDHDDDENSNDKSDESAEHQPHHSPKMASEIVIAKEANVADAATKAPPLHEEEGYRRRSGSQKRQRQPSGTYISEELADETLLDDPGVTIASPTLPLNREGEELMEELSTSFSSTSPQPLQTRKKEEGEEEAIVGHYSTATTGAPHSIPSSDPAHSALHVPSRRKRISDLLPPEKEIQPPAESATIDNATHSRQLPIPSIYTNLQHSPMLYIKSHSPPLPLQQQQHPGRRSITLRLVEEIPSPPHNPLSSPLLSTVGTPFRSLRRFTLSSRNLSGRARSGSDGGFSPLDEKTSSSLTNITGNEGTTTGNNWNANNNINGSGRESTDVDRGTITVSWYEGTTSKEMQEHVFNCVLRKLNSSSGVPHHKENKGRGKIKLEDVRLLDENVTPHEEVVLCPFLPDNSCFLLKFKTSIERPPTAPPKVNYRQSYVSRAPDSPSAEPIPRPSNVNLSSLDPMHSKNMSGMQNQQHEQQQHEQRQQNAQQMQLLNTVAALLQQQQQPQTLHSDNHSHHLASNAAQSVSSQHNGYQSRMMPLPQMETVGTIPNNIPTTQIPEAEDTMLEDLKAPVASNSTTSSNNTAVKKVASGGATPNLMEPIAEDSTTDQLIEQQLRQLNNLVGQRRSGDIVGPADKGPSSTVGPVNDTTNDGNHQASDEQLMLRAYHRAEKQQVTYFLANYLVLFMGFIALSAEIQSRLPTWMRWVQQNYDSVQNCATDRDALIECLSNGDFSGLVASFLLWATQSAAAKRVFLFGFDTPKKLWIVVYEALVTAVCWGTSYLFIRRGLNPNTRENFLHKYWKDAVYGSLAGFNAAFMKAVLKNLIPQDVALEALEGGRQWRIFHWLGAASAPLHTTVNPALKESV